MKNVSVAQKMNLPWVESPFFEDRLLKKDLSPEQREMVVQYNREGFLVVRQQVNPELIDRTLREIEHEYPARVGEQPTRHQDLWKKYATVREMAGIPAVFDTLHLLYDREPIPFQTLNFKFGTQQRAHSDTIHFSSTPARFMCGVWVAMEETDTTMAPCSTTRVRTGRRSSTTSTLALKPNPNTPNIPRFHGRQRLPTTGNSHAEG